jgi:hypothetical protein
MIQQYTDMWVVVRSKQSNGKTILWLFMHDTIPSGQQLANGTTF